MSKKMDTVEFFRLHKSVAVALSGGVDSAVLLALALKYAERVKPYFVKSAFQPDFEYGDALSVADAFNVELKVIEIDVLSDADIVKNPSNRCYYCKKRIFGAIIRAAENDGFKTVIEGTNATDDISDRPGFAALGELGVLSPLRECGYGKKEIRKIAKENGLPVADKPSYACLATRIPTGTPITEELLRKTGSAEKLLRNIGFRNFRIRYLDGDANIELGRSEFGLFCKSRNEIVSLLSPFYKNVYLDLRERADE